jgi:isoleucyl-tRNA synthetase
LLVEELNVKEVQHLESVWDIVRPIFKLNYVTLGRRLRGDVKKVAAALEAGTYELSEDRSTLRVANYEFSGDDFTVRYESQREGTGVAVEGTLVVVLDLKMDDDLVAEGKARLLNRHLQNLRKEAGLAYADRVIISVQATAAWQRVVDQYRVWLTEQLLAKEILAYPLSDATHKSQVEIEGETVEIALRVAD